MAVSQFKKGGPAFTFSGDTGGAIMKVPAIINGLSGGTVLAKLKSALDQLPAYGTVLDATNFPDLVYLSFDSVALRCVAGEDRVYLSMNYGPLFSSIQLIGASDTAPPIVESGSVSQSVQSNFLANGLTVDVFPPTTQIGKDPQKALFNKFIISHVLRLRRREASTAYEGYSRTYSGKTNSAIFRGRPVGTLLMLDIQGSTSTQGNGYDVVYDMAEDPNGFVERVAWQNERGQPHKDVTLGNGAVDVTGQYDSIDFNLIPGLNA